MKVKLTEEKIYEIISNNVRKALIEKKMKEGKYSKRNY